VHANFIPYAGMATAPSISMVSPVYNETYSGDCVSLVFDVIEPESYQTGRGTVNWIAYTLDGSEPVNVTGTKTLSQTTWVYTTHVECLLDALPAGEHELTVMVCSTWENSSAAAEESKPTITSYLVYFTTSDTVAPKICIVSPENESYCSCNVSVSFTVDETVSWVAYRLDNCEQVAVNENDTVTLTKLSEGLHNITLYAMDLAGNPATSETVFFVVTMFPTSWFVIEVGLLVAMILAVILFKYKQYKDGLNEQNL